MDNDAFEALFREHYASLATFALRYLRDRSIAEVAPGTGSRVSRRFSAPRAR